MATKTISIELDACEHLRRARRHERESFSSVVRRANFATAIHTGGSILEKLKSLPPVPDSTFAHCNCWITPLENNKVWPG
jgi:hypothetical protein